MSPRRWVPPALYRKNSFLQAILGTMPYSIKVVDSNFKIIYANTHALTPLNLKLNQVRGKLCHKEFFGFDSPCFFCIKKKVLDKKEKQINYFTMVVNGTTHQFESLIYPIKFEKESPLYVVEIVQDVTYLFQSLNIPQQVGKLFSRHNGFNQIFEHIAHWADEMVPIFIQGEKGTGKKLVARALHERSKRAKYPFRIFNCLEHSSCYESLLGSNGVWNKISSGTLVLNEIQRLSLEIQDQLGEKISHMGADAPRIIGSTQERIESLIQSGKISEKLYKCFDHHLLYLPPLRERRQDLPSLAQHFIETCKAFTGSPAERLSANAFRQLMMYAWPGNIRELEAEIERACLLAQSSEIEHLEIPIAEVPLDKWEEMISETEKKYLVNILVKVRGNIRQAANLSGLSLKTMQRKIKKYDLRSVEFKQYIIN